MSKLKQNLKPYSPDIRTSKDGHPYDLNSDLWVIPNAIKKQDITKEFKFNFDKYKDRFTPKLINSLKLRLIVKLNTGAVGSAFASFHEFIGGMVDNKEPLNTITLEHIKTPISRNLFSFLKSWKESEVKGLDLTDKDIEYLNRNRTQTDNYVNIRTDDPYSGALWGNEISEITNKVIQLFPKKINLQELLIFGLARKVGLRNEQMALLTCADFVLDDDDNYYQLTICRIKNSRQRRKEETYHKLNKKDEFWLLFSKFVEKRCFQHQHKNPQEIPIFKCEGNLKSYIKTTFKKLKKEVNYQSTRIENNTNRGVEFSLKQFRHSRITELVDLGFSPFVVARSFGISGKTIKYYLEASDKHAQKVNTTMSKNESYAMDAQGFAGNLIFTKAESANGNNPSKIQLNNHTAEEIGVCGKDGPCMQNAPIACYTCSLFQPLVEANHIAVRDQLLEKRQQQVKTGVSGKLIEALDCQILAVIKINDLAEIRKKEVA